MPRRLLAAEFRQRAVELARAGDKPVAVLAKDLGVSESYLRDWTAQADTDTNGSDVRLTSAEKKELQSEPRHVDGLPAVMRTAPALRRRRHRMALSRAGRVP